MVVEDEAAVSAYSGVHQFCRVGKQAFVGGYSVVTKDALPYGRTVGNRARIYGLNTVGLVRRDCQPDTIAKLKSAYRYLLQSKLNTTQALRRIESEASLRCAEVDYLIQLHPELQARGQSAPAAAHGADRRRRIAPVAASCSLG